MAYLYLVMDVVIIAVNDQLPADSMFAKLDDCIVGMLFQDEPKAHPFHMCNLVPHLSRSLLMVTRTPEISIVRTILRR